MTIHPLRVGIIGAGTMGRAYAEALRTTDLRFRAELVAVCDQDHARARALAGASARAYSDVTSMLADERLDWVYQATPDSRHLAPFVACMNAGVPCLVEKPLATTVADARAMAAAARAAGVHAEVNFSNHVNPAFIAAKDAIDSGKVGRPLSVYARLSNVFTYPLDNLTWAAESSVGWFLISHIADLATWLTGWTAASVLAHGSKGRLASLGVDTYDLIQCLVTYTDGTSALLEASWVLPESMPSIVDLECVVHGDRGQLSVDTTRQMVTVAAEDSYTYPATQGWSQLRISGCLDRLDQPVDAEPLRDGVANTAFLVALHRSLESGRIEAVREDEDAEISA